MKHFWMAIFRNDGKLDCMLFDEVSEATVKELIQRQFEGCELVSIQEVRPPERRGANPDQWQTAMEHLYGLGSNEVMTPSPSDLFEQMYLLGYLHGSNS